MKSLLELSRKSREQLHRRYRAVFVGLFIAVPLVALPCFLIVTFFKTDVLEKPAYLYVKYPHAAGLAKGTAVTILGMKVGYIQSVALNDSGFVDVCMKIKPSNLHYIKKGGKARLQQKNVAFGDWEIELVMGMTGAGVVSTGDTLRGEVQAPVAKTLESLNCTIETVQKILRNVLDGKGAVGRIMKEDTLVSIAQDIGREAVHVIRQTDDALKQASGILSTVQTIGNKGNHLADSISAISGKISNLVGDMDSLIIGIRSASKDLPGLMNKVQSDISEVELMLKALQNNWLFKSSITGQKDPILNDKQ
jgi:ABC-type transporter Mla subunit MlaD